MGIEVPDLNTAHDFIVGAIDRYSTCIASFAPLQSASETVRSASSSYVSPIMEASTSLPEQILSLATLALGAALWALGYKLVRPVNFIAGAYFGSTMSLLLLKIFAPTLTSCSLIVAVGTVSGLIVGVLCALKRAAVLIVLGLVAGEIVGDLVYKSLLSSVAPEYVAFGCIGFFAVLMGVLFGHVGDFAWKLGCAFFGAYLMIESFLKLLLIPYVPNGYKFREFVTFQPDISQAVSKGGEYASFVVASPFVWGPTVVLIVLTSVGTWLQVRLLKQARLAAVNTDKEQLIAK
mmetsp:Transcript_49963/g.99488  ORF Transcript_49963/g.99488 Transcript_49963/m.99488 type:complete len:291 (-) Transcript_49963:388-1260(-)